MRWLAVTVLAALAGCGGAGSSGTEQGAASEQREVPAEVRPACGKPGASVELRRVPVTIAHADCDLRGVTLTHQRVGALVPQRGSSVGNLGSVPQGAVSRSASVEVDAATGDVTFSYSEASTSAGEDSPTTANAGSECLTGERNIQSTDEYVGMTEAEALERARTKFGGRVAARDGECLGRSRDLADGRVNLVVVDGEVVSAAVETLPR